jgi:hypothetical protein
MGVCMPRRRVFIDPQTGIEHDFCGRTHAKAALEQQGRELPPPHGACHVCKLAGCNQPVFFEEGTGRVHDFCCLTHAQMAREAGVWPASNRRLQGHAHPDNRCALPGCSAPRFADPATGFVHDFCGRTHAQQAQARGMMGYDLTGVQDSSSMVDRVWRGRDSETPYVISMLTNRHPKYQGIKDQFLISWLHVGPKPTVMRIYQVRNPQQVFSTYSAYKESLPVAAESRRWHGTSMAPSCSFGIDINQRPCSDPTCAVCTICATSFDVAHSGRAAFGGSARRALRYGRGLYFSRVSSKSNDYNEKTERQSSQGRFRIMFLCKVALGSEWKVPDEDLGEQDVDAHVAARGYGGHAHSVTGLTIADGGKLNFEASASYLSSVLVLLEFLRDIARYSAWCIYRGACIT